MSWYHCYLLGALIICLTDMRKDASDCIALIEKTANVLNDGVLKLLFVSVQQNHIDLCARHAVKDVFHQVGVKRTVTVIMHDILAWYPHIWRANANYEANPFKDFSSGFYANARACAAALIKQFPALSQPTSLLTSLRIAEFTAATCICAEQTFFEVSANKDDFVPAFTTALAAYVASGLGDDVNKEIGILVDEKDKLDLDAFTSELCRIVKTHRLRIHPI